MEDAVRKMTSLPAQVLGLKDRGLLKEGYWADVVVSIPTPWRIRRLTTIPNSIPKGIDYVLSMAPWSLKRSPHRSAAGQSGIWAGEGGA